MQLDSSQAYVRETTQRTDAMPRHINVLEQSSDDYVICLPLVTHRQLRNELTCHNYYNTI